MQILEEPLTKTLGRLYTVIPGVLREVQPVLAWIKLKVDMPPVNPDTTPLLVTVAIDGLLLTHVPPLEGASRDVLPAHIADAPAIATAGRLNTVIGTLLRD